MKKVIDFIIGILTAILSVFLILHILDNKGHKNSKVKPYKEVSKIDKCVEINKQNLNERQVLILKQFENSSILYPLDIYKLLPEVSTRTIRRDMSHLVGLGLVIQEGSTKDTRYLLNV